MIISNKIYLLFDVTAIISYVTFSTFFICSVAMIHSINYCLFKVPVINISILALLVLMACLLYSKIAVIHIIVMSTLAVGLLASVNWYVLYERIHA
jgi:hypothetical protein